MNNDNLHADFSVKADFFKGGSFRVNLSSPEISNRVFIPGHRLIPFLSPAVRPWNIKITDHAGNSLPRKTISANSEILKPFYSLYGEENFLFLLIDDRSENSGIILKGASDVPYKLNATVFDLSQLLPETKESPADNLQAALIFKIEDWEKGIYKVSLHNSDTENKGAAEWVEILENGFKTVLEKNKKLQMVQEVMSEAFLYGGKALLENPVLSLEDFFDISEISDIADMLSVQKEDPEIARQKHVIREKTIKLIKTLTSWLENGSADIKNNPEDVKILEKQVLMTKRTLIAVLEELNNPFISEEMIKTMLQVISESSQLVSKIK
ncbi:MAG: hypothetical protein RBT69_10255 [Spirochaetia bacterium]|jgi:hypothetical protein|nr:hypothetical protein [Spirochaetia bacterium]